MNKWLKLSLLIVMTVVIAILAYNLIRQIMIPLDYQEQLKTREAAVIDRIKDIRSAEQAYKLKNQRYTADWDSLINFVLTDSLEFEREYGSKDDSVAVARGEWRIEKFMKAVKDTIFAPKRLDEQQIRDIKFVPYAEDGTQYILNASMLTTESKVVVPVFEAKAPYKDFMGDLDHQELVNLIDEAKNVYFKYPGIAVGSIDRATNDAGNWE